MLVVDDQELFAGGLKIILEAVPDIEFSVFVAYNGRDAVQMAKDIKPELVLMDVRMPVMDGVEATRIIHKEHPDIKIIILTTFDDDDYVFSALEGGAVGYILKDLKPEDLVNSVKAALSGTFLISPKIGIKLIQRASGSPHLSEGEVEIRHHGIVNFLRAHFPDLSKREAEVLRLLLQDLDNREIAENLYIAEQTVKNYTSSIYDKLGVTDRIHAIRLVKKIRSR